MHAKHTRNIVNAQGYNAFATRSRRAVQRQSRKTFCASTPVMTQGKHETHLITGEGRGATRAGVIVDDVGCSQCDAVVRG